MKRPNINWNGIAKTAIVTNLIILNISCYRNKQLNQQLQNSIVQTQMAYMQYVSQQQFDYENLQKEILRLLQEMIESFPH